MSEDVKFMTDRFSAHREQIFEAYQTNDEFKTLCEDFYSSALMLEKFLKKIIKDKKVSSSIANSFWTWKMKFLTS